MQTEVGGGVQPMMFLHETCAENSSKMFPVWVTIDIIYIHGVLHAGEWFNNAAILDGSPHSRLAPHPTRVDAT